MVQQKVALVTGALGGIGTAICRQLIDDGFEVVASGRPGREADFSQWIEENQLDGDKISLVTLDVTDTDMCAQKLKELVEKKGRVDVLVNNAGITRDSAFKRMEKQQWSEVIDNNLNSLFNVTQPLFQTMCEQGNARIINITSVNGLKGQFGQANYAATKAGMIGFTKSLAYEGAKSGVTVNAIAPGYTSTPMVEKIKPEILDAIKADIPMKRLASVKEIADTVSFLASDKAGYITGATLSVNGGQFMH